ncbi:MAG: LPS-assembly protein LptD, partial [Flavobacteriales bacterium]|nr:LPS-assembly protein LptD [Flavobacteriales bacterium]
MGRHFKVSKLFLAILLIRAWLSPLESAANLDVGASFEPEIQSDTLTFPLAEAETVPINVSSADSITPIVDSLLVSPAAINTSIFYDATDSIVFDAIEEKVYLYNNAVVKFEDMTLTAAFIEYSFADNLACANGVADSTGKMVGIPQFKDGQQGFDQQSLCYNFRTKKGYSRQVVTQEGEAYVHSSIAKRQENEWVHIKDGKFTTCSADNPHYHFHITKGIIIPNERIVTGPVYMKVRKVPMPLALPFGFFPNKQESSHGLILPGYGNADRLGYFLKGLGYYVPIGDYFDTKMLFDIYSRGSWSARNVTNYKLKYRFSGNLDISRTVTKTGFEELPSFSKKEDFFVRWSHTQDSKARPNTRFGVSINAGTSTNFQNNLSSNQNDLVSNTFTSSVNWSKSWKNKYNFSVQGRHTQNTLTRNVDILLPSITFSRNRFDLPLGFLNPNAGTKKAWYEKIGVSYSVVADNQLSAKEQDVS